MVGIRPNFLYKSERSSRSKALVEDDVEKLVPDPSILRGSSPCIGITLLDIVVAIVLDALLLVVALISVAGFWEGGGELVVWAFSATGLLF